MTLPTFLILGAQRCGTTSLRVYLSSHPDVFMPDTETAYFSRHHNKGLGWYSSHFKTKTKLVGEKCAGYLSDPKAPKRISNHLPNPRFIVLLRNPVDRAWSHYLWAKSMHEEAYSFKVAILRGSYTQKYGEHSGYLSRGLYADQLERWFSVFPKDCFLIIKSEAMFASPTTTYEEVLSFLELRGHGIDEGQHGTVPIKGTIDPIMRRWLQDYYRPHNKHLEQLLDRSFGWDD